MSQEMLERLLQQADETIKENIEKSQEESWKDNIFKDWKQKPCRPSVRKVFVFKKFLTY